MNGKGGAIHPVYADMETTVFEAMSGLARQLGAINLGQGFPDDQGPPVGTTDCPFIWIAGRGDERIGERGLVVRGDKPARAGW